ncbi:fasciclin domain-containing protein [Rudanella paleaurantiibacter]|uniref:Fasciclin domain-containing protein n=1 Tax=Rudanella paleaurantiibacter TaxID=2614655 RepID=A0A7J5U384_9BACT|nr:fasciclin domain-containing protein [Rudanella paleaurantiibacter]KAB7732160.1 fasciclin domain-containing protein [Rudanella paleaurantiibacter]
MRSTLRVWSSVLSLLLVLGCLIGCDKSTEEATPKSVSELIGQDASFSLLRAAVQRANLSDALKATNLTVFAPNDDAFKAAGFADIAAVNNAPVAQLERIVKYHLFNGIVKSDAPQLGANTPVQSVEGSTAYISRISSGSATGVTINGARVVKADQEVANGIVHTIDRVLLPPANNILSALQADPANFSLVVAAINRIPQLTALLSATNSPNGPVTLFVPDNAAFTAAGSPYTSLAAINGATLTALTSLLSYHATNGLLFSDQLAAGQLSTLNPASARLTIAITNNVPTVKGNQNTSPATIKRADIITNNGLIHVVSQVLRP